MPLFKFGMRKHEDAFAQLEALRLLPEEIPPAEASGLVARASATAYSSSFDLVEKWLAEPERSFGIKAARRGTPAGIEAVLIWTDPNVQPLMTGGVTGFAGSPHGSTYVFGTHGVSVPAASIHPRPRSVPTSAGGELLGDEPFDSLYLVAGDDLHATLPPHVAEVFAGAGRRAFGWAAVWEHYVCMHSVDPPGEKTEAMLDLVTRVAAAYEAR